MVEAAGLHSVQYRLKKLFPWVYLQDKSES